MHTKTKRGTTKRRKRTKAKGKEKKEKEKKKKKKKKKGKKSKKGEIKKSHFRGSRGRIKNKVRFPKATTRAGYKFRPPTPCDARLIEEVEGGLEMAITNLKDTRWNKVCGGGGSGDVHGLCCVVCGEFKSLTSSMISHELKCISKFSAAAVKSLLWKCEKKNGCKDLRVECRCPMRHNCPKSVDVAEKREKITLALLRGKVNSFEEFPNTRE